jgi:hypothetical protein
MTKSAHSVLKEFFVEEDVDTLLADTRQELGNLIPQLPFIGRKQPFAEFLVFTGMLLAIFRTCKIHGKTVEQTGELVYKIGRAIMKSSPSFLLRLFMPLNFSPTSLNRLQQRAIRSHLREYPDGYVFDFIEGDGLTFDYGVDYLECASCKFLTKQGALELAPFLCTVDILYSEALGWGLMRTKTLAEGAEKCDFRFKKGGPTKVVFPEALRAIISGTK